MIDLQDLPCRLVTHLLEAYRDEDAERLERIIRKSRRLGAALAPELAATRETLESLPEERAVVVSSAIATVGAATRCPEGRAFVLLDFAHGDTYEGGHQFQSLLEDDAEGWVAAALHLLTRAHADADLAAIEVCVELLGCTQPDSPGVVDALLALLPDYPGPVVRALRARDEPEITAPLLDWLRAQPDPADLPPERCEAFVEAASALHQSGVALTQADVRRMGSAADIATAHLRTITGHLRAILERDQRDDETRLRARERLATGPNAPCACGSGRKTKTCCG